MAGAPPRHGGGRWCEPGFAACGNGRGWSDMVWQDGGVCSIGKTREDAMRAYLQYISPPAGSPTSPISPCASPSIRPPYILPFFSSFFLLLPAVPEHPCPYPPTVRRLSPGCHPGNGMATRRPIPASAASAAFPLRQHPYTCQSVRRDHRFALASTGYGAPDRRCGDAVAGTGQGSAIVVPFYVSFTFRALGHGAGGSGVGGLVSRVCRRRGRTRLRGVGIRP